MRKRSQAIIAAMLALGMAVGMCGCEGQLPTPKATTRQDALAVLDKALDTPPAATDKY